MKVRDLTMLERLGYTALHEKKTKIERELNKSAFSIVAQATGCEQQEEEGSPKNPAAVELGRLGGLKGGKARADKLSAKRRKEIAKKAAEARWKKKPNQSY